ncbi:MAG: hypothetical protein K1X56_03950 [Flavobacteriales bacterium]|nr:hypothetical protein [Flavobacteriales bacterium]
MKKLNVISMVLVALGAVAFLYNYFVVQPHLGILDNPNAGPAEFARYSEYRSLSDLSGLAGTILAGIGFILGLISYFKSKTGSALLFALLGLVVAFMSFYLAFARVAL